MRLTHLLLAGALAAGIHALPAVAGEAGSPADRPAVPERVVEAPDAGALPGTPAEVVEYARREAASPEVQDFAGGEVVVVVGVFGACLFLFLLVVFVE